MCNPLDATKLHTMSAILARYYQGLDGRPVAAGAPETVAGVDREQVAHERAALDPTLSGIVRDMAHLQVGSSLDLDSPAVISSLLKDTPLAHLPPEGQAILEKLLALSIDTKLLSPLSPERGRCRDEIRVIQESFKKYCVDKALPLPIDDADEPIIFLAINEKASQRVEHIITQRKEELVVKCRPGIDFSRLSHAEFEGLHGKCVEEMQVLERVQKQIRQFVELAKLPDDIKHYYQISITQCGVPRGDERAPFLLSTDFYPMAYSLHDLFSQLNFCTKGYNGTQQFVLTFDQLKELSKYLSNFMRWVDDFTLILGDLTGDVDHVKNYVTLGHKKVISIIRSAQGLSKAIQDTLSSSGEHMPCLLFGEVCLDLHDHPQRDFLKSKFEGMYALEGMIGANGKRKQFIKDETTGREEYRSLLSIGQVSQICPRLNKLLKFQQQVKEFTGQRSLKESLDVLQEMGIAEFEGMKHQGISRLHELVHSINKDCTLKQAVIDSLSIIPSLDDFERETLKIYEGVVREISGVYFRENAETFVLSPSERAELYDQHMMVEYRGHQLHKNTEKLFERLRESSAFKAALAKYPDLQESLSELQDEFTRRLNEYHTLSTSNQFYGRPLVDEAVNFLEMYVAKIVFTRSRITQESIERSLLLLAARNGEDMAHGCARGFSGRIQDMLLALTASVGNDLQDHMREFKRECLETAFQEIYQGNSESSMAVSHKGEANECLALGGTGSAKTYDRLSPQAKTILQHFFVYYTPVTIYHKAHKFFSDMFWQYNCENDNERMYQLLSDLGLGTTHSELDKKYRVNGDPQNNWQYAYFQHDLPQILIPYLIREKSLFAKSDPCNDSMFMNQASIEVKVPVPALIPRVASAGAAAAIRDVVPGDRRFGQEVKSLPGVEHSSS